MSLSLPRHGDPILSAVIVTYGAWELAERAIRALAEHTRVPFELIVVDNASTDATRTQLSQLEGARTILNDENRGFGPAANQGAQAAVGEYLLLLNSDAFVHAAWLEPLLETLARPTVGAVVPRVLASDGLLQEAGALLARDGTVQLYGEGDDPARGQYRFRREIDYGSAVCMLTRRATFASLGGFDERYGQAYYEDVDLCMRVIEHGMCVVYEPRSTVTHVRYGSGGLNAAMALSEQNRRLFIERWAPRLLGRPSSFVRPSSQATILARDVRAWPRFLVCAAGSDSLAQRAVEQLLDDFATARVTWATGPGAPGDVRSGDGVEHLDDADPSWLNARLFHYDAVLRAATAPSELVEAVRHSQPQAPQIMLETTATSQLACALAGAGIAPIGRLSA